MLEKNKLWNALVSFATFETLRHRLYLRQNRKLQEKMDKELEKARLIQKRLAILDG